MPVPRNVAAGAVRYCASVLSRLRGGTSRVSQIVDRGAILTCAEGPPAESPSDDGWNAVGFLAAGLRLGVAGSRALPACSRWRRLVAGWSGRRQTTLARPVLQPGQHGRGICHCLSELQQRSRHCHVVADPLGQFGTARSASAGLSPAGLALARRARCCCSRPAAAEVRVDQRVSRRWLTQAAISNSGIGRSWRVRHRDVLLPPAARGARYDARGEHLGLTSSQRGESRTPQRQRSSALAGSIRTIASPATSPNGSRSTRRQGERAGSRPEQTQTC